MKTSTVAPSNSEVLVVKLWCKTFLVAYSTEKVIAQMSIHRGVSGVNNAICFLKLVDHDQRDLKYTHHSN